MKFLIITLISFYTSLSVVIYAQTQLGFKGGLNNNSIAMRKLPDGYSNNMESINSFHLGVFTNLNISKRISIIPELQFIKKGYAYDIPINGDKIRIHINYIELPIMMSFEVNKWLSIEAGPSLGLKMSAKSKSKILGTSDYETRQIEVGAGSGLRINLTDKLSLIGRYALGITSIDHLYYDFGTYKVKTTYHNQSLQFSITYFLLH